MQNPVLFTLTVLAILATPGPTNTLLATAGATDGLRRALVLIPAEAVGYFTAILGLRLVLGPLVSEPLVGNSAMVIATLRLLVAGYLLWVSWRLWIRGADPATEGGTFITTGQVFLTTLLNPKAIVFALGIIPFAVPHVSLYLIAFQLMAAAVGILWIAGGAMLGRLAKNRSTLIPRMGAAILGVFAITLVASPLLH
jgi:threonine/homoserine/homoserine lactone efflux protein